MTNSEKNEIVYALSSSVNDLRQRIDVHCHLLSSLMGEQAKGMDTAPFPECHPCKSKELMLKEAIREAIEVIEDSRKAFKSKRLEALRKKLTSVLIEDE